MTTIASFSLRALVCATGLLLVAGCGGDDSPTKPGGSDDPPADTTAPLVSGDLPVTTVRAAGSVTMTVTASDDVGVVRVELLKNGVVAATDDDAPWEFTIACTSADNGLHTFALRAHDAAGNTADSAPCELAVAIDLVVGFVNGGFDVDLTGWTVHHVDEYDHGHSADGGNPGGCLRLNESGNCGIDPGAEQAVSGLVPSIAFRISGDYKPFVDWIGSPSAESFVVTVDSTVVASLARGANGSDWTPFQVEFTATDVTHTIGFFAEWSCDDSSYDVDNLVLEVAP